jgi:hypothetical protein
MMSDVLIRSEDVEEENICNLDTFNDDERHLRTDYEYQASIPCAE